MKVPESLFAVAKRPDMYGVYDLSDYIAYLLGYELACFDRGEKTFDGLQEWVSKHFREPPANHWASVLKRRLPPGRDGIDQVAVLLLRFSKGDEVTRRASNRPRNKSDVA